MKRIVILGVALVASFSLVAVDAISVSASGDEFVASKTGKVKSKQANAQKFKTSAGTIECTEVSGSSEITELKSVTHKEVLTFGGCVGFGGNITISSASLELNANGSAKLEKRVTIKPEGAGCSVLIEPQTLEGVNYTNVSGGKVTVELNMGNIHSKGTGGSCGGTENTEGSYTGKITSELESGTLEWKS
ncbi:MAG: hypothetical protein ABR992_15665 [Solirubrobacteraceae bacterium]|jgi:hypothetical protein